MAANEDESRPDAREGPSCVEELYFETRSALIAYVRPLAHSSEDAEEIARDAYARLKHLEARKVNDLRALLFRTARNLATSPLRVRITRERTDELMPFDEEDHHSSSELPRENVDSMHALRKALHELPADSRDVFLLSRRDGLRPREIAERSGQTKRSVRRKLARVLRHLFTCLGAR